MQGCSLCSDLTALEVLFEDDRIAVVLHDDWAVRGHVMVVWKDHVENVSGLNEHEWRHLAECYRRTERALLDVTQAERAVMMKLGVATPHLHIHIYPVSESLTREEIVEIIDARNKQPYDAVFVRALRNRLDRVLSTE